LKDFKSEGIRTMIILGIDTSCDDTCAAVVEDGKTVLSNIVSSQGPVHHRYGGVVPELASREHIRNIVPVVDEALDRAGVDRKELDAIAVTSGPGLVGALLVGIYFAKAFSVALDVPLVGVNHLEGHILSIFLEKLAPSFPFIALTVSGGHTNIYHVQGFGDYTVLGQTLDDAAGEAFDKIAKLLGLGYPGGAAIEQLALQGRDNAVDFPRAYLSADSLNFSFSGLKTAVVLYVRKWLEQKQINPKVSAADIAASFQAAVVDVLTEKVAAAAGRAKVPTAVLAGGVARNSRLRSTMQLRMAQEKVDLFISSPEFCTDNGAMIAVAGYHRFMSGHRDGLTLDARSRFPINQT
jgi:N6-L-threonylcarbamoyladenine synthase